MAITFSGVQSNVVAATSVTTTTPTAPGGGALNSSHVIFAIVDVGGGPGSEWAGYSAAGWNRVGWYTGGSSRMHVLWRQATASEPANYTFGAYTSAGVTYAQMFSAAGINTTTPINDSNSLGSGANGASLVVPEVSPTSITTAMLLWVGYGRGNNLTTSSTVSSSGTELYDVNGGTTDSARGAAAGYYEQLSASGPTGSRTITWLNSAGERIGVMMALNPASASYSVGVPTSSTVVPIKTSFKKNPLVSTGQALAKLSTFIRERVTISSSLFKAAAKLTTKPIAISGPSTVSVTYGSLFSRAVSVLTGSEMFSTLIPGKVISVLSGSLPSTVIKSAISSRVITTVQELTPFKKSTKKASLSVSPSLTRSMLGTAHVPNTMEWVSNTPTAGGSLGFPQVAATNSGNQATDTTIHTINLPTGITAGDLLMAFISMDSTTTYLSGMTGWTQLGAHASLTPSIRVYYKIATGSEGSTASITIAESEQSAHITYRITNWHGTTVPEISTVATGTSTSPNSAQLDPSAWGTEDTLWMSVAAWDNGGVSASVYSSNLPDNHITARTSTTTGVGIATATVGFTGASVDPGSFALSASESWKAYTIAVRPATSSGATVIVVGSPPYEMRVPRGAYSPGDLLFFTLAASVPINFTTVPSGWIEIPDTPYVSQPVVDGTAEVYLKSYYKIAGVSEPTTYSFWSSVVNNFAAAITAYSNPRDTLTQVGERSLYSPPNLFGVTPVLPGIPYAEDSALLVRTIGSRVQAGTPSGNTQLAPPALHTERWEGDFGLYYSSDLSDRFVASGSGVPASTSTLAMDVFYTTWKKSNSPGTYSSLAWASDDTSSTTATISRSKSGAGDFTAHSTIVLWMPPRLPTPTYPNDATFVSAKMKLYVTSKTNANARDLVLVWREQANNASTGWVNTVPVAGDATFVTSIPINNLVVGQVNEIPIPDEWLNRLFTFAFSTTSTTYYVPMSLAISGGSPGGTNSVVIATEEHATLPAPSMELVYTQSPSVPRTTATIVPPNSGLTYEWVGQTVAFAPSTHEEFTRFVAFNVLANSIPLLKKTLPVIKTILSATTTGLQKTRFLTRSQTTTQTLSILKSSTRTVSLSASQALSGIFRGLYLRVFSVSNASTTTGLFQTVKAHVAIVATSSTLALKRGFFMFNDIATGSALSVIKTASRIKQMSATHSLSFVEMRHLLKNVATGSTTMVLKTMNRLRGLTNGWSLARTQTTTLRKAIASSSAVTIFKSLVYWLIGRRGI